jgi:PTH1 family peptidyl-tRNA hydrolase
MVDSTTPRLSIVVGLGNPGAKYDWTRHNIGFECLNELRRRYGSLSPQVKFEGQFVKTKIGERDVCLLWPLTYMNCSGRCVSQFARFYRVEPQHILVVCDDLSLPLGKLRLRKSGSSGGQKGLDDILRCLGTQGVPRLRIGIDPTPERWETVDYVLSRFTVAEKDTVQSSLARASDAIERWIASGIDVAMNEFNASPQPGKKSKNQDTRETTTESDQAKP